MAAHATTEYMMLQQRLVLFIPKNPLKALGFVAKTDSGTKRKCGEAKKVKDISDYNLTKKQR